MLSEEYIELEGDQIDKKYLLQRFDKILAKEKYDTKGIWTNLDGWHNRTVEQLEKMQHFKIIKLHIKGPPKPRFPTDKPFPFGW